MLISLPMYDINPDDVDLFWSRLRQRLVRLGVCAVPPALSRDADIHRHWRAEDLLLSQTCGYPLTTQLPQVQVVGQFHYTASGCEGGDYRSLLIVRNGDVSTSLADFRGRIAVCNSVDSHSGYNILRAMVAPLAVNGTFFARVLISGSHRQSLAWVRDGRAAIAAIDCVTWALLKRQRPAELRGIKVIEDTPSAPGLPLITAAATPPALLTLLRQALRQTVQDPANRTICDALLIRDFRPVSRADYQPIEHMREQAARWGVVRL